MGEVLTYGYDPARRQTSMTSNIGGTYLGNTTYDALNQPLTKALGNGTTETYTYETASVRLQSLRVTQPNSAQALKREYTYHAGGNVRSIKNTKHTGAVESIAYGYDQLDRLTLACAWNFSTNSCVSGQFNQSFRYDKLGNILTKAGTSYTYDSSKPHAVTVATALITRLDFVHELTETVYVTQFDETSFTSKLTHRDFKPLLILQL